MTSLTVHPWTGSFSWEDRTGPFRRLSVEQVAAFDQSGFVVLPDVFDASRIAAVREEIDAFEAGTESFLRGRRDERQLIAEAGAITFTTHLVTRSESLLAFALDEVFADLCHDLIGPDANLYWDQAVYKKPEKPRRFPWHQDNGYQFVAPQQYLTCWLALTDATLDNGCPQVAPGLHRTGTLWHEYVDPLGFEGCSDPGEVAVAEVAAGGMVVFSSLTPHLTGPNTTDAVRKAYILQYAPAGAHLQHGDPQSGPPTGTTPADAPDRQPPIIRDGLPVR